MRSKLVIPSQLKAWKEKYSEIEKLTDSRYGGALICAYEDLDLSVLYMSEIHGTGHIERTMLLGALIALNEGLNDRDTWMVLKCCSYHDIGRIDDSVDREHGKRSADNMLINPISKKLSGATDEELQIMRAAVTAHSISDSKLDDVIIQFNIEDIDHFKLITACLKDADNLDRVRLGDLDARHLRFEKSKLMVPLAETIFKEYSKKK